MTVNYVFISFSLTITFLLIHFISIPIFYHFCCCSTVMPVMEYCYMMEFHWWWCIVPGGTGYITDGPGSLLRTWPVLLHLHSCAFVLVYPLCHSLPAWSGVHSVQFSCIWWSAVVLQAFVDTWPAIWKTCCCCSLYYIPILLSIILYCGCDILMTVVLCIVIDVHCYSVHCCDLILDTILLMPFVHSDTLLFCWWCYTLFWYIVVCSFYCLLSHCMLPCSTSTTDYSSVPTLLWYDWYLWCCSTFDDIAFIPVFYIHCSCYRYRYSDTLLQYDDDASRWCDGILTILHFWYILMHCCDTSPRYITGTFTLYDTFTCWLPLLHSTFSLT